MRAIEGFSRILSEDYGEALDAEGKRFLDHIVQSTQFMGEMIEGLLMYSRLSERTLIKIPVDMTALTREVWEAIPKPETVPEIKLGALAKVSADPTMLRTLWEHLISNAIKFSKRQKKPSIEFGCDQRDGQSIFWIKDNGVGFDMRYSDKLFQLFQKLQKEPDFPGHGVGLALVRRIAERHDGRVWVEAAPDQGATFYVALPA